MAILRLAIQSVWNRRLTALLTVLAVALSVTLLLGVERLRNDARSSFANTVSGTDLIVGARSGSIQLLLYSVFRIGHPTNNVSWQSYQDIARHPLIEWTIPISLGDSHHGFRVLGTTTDYFRHYRFSRGRGLEFAEGGPFDDLYDAVLGADVAAALGYRLGQHMTIAHGAGEIAILEHDDKPFRVVGILRKTGTPVDRTVHVSLAGIEAIHIDWQQGVPTPGGQVSADAARHMDLTPRTITAFLVGLKTRAVAFRVQRFINDYRQEPLLAILPGVALQELWDLMATAEHALLTISVFVVLVGLIGMATVMLTSLNERRREMAILRSVGARPAHIFALVIGEAASLTVAGAVAGTALLYLLMAVAQPIIEARMGLLISLGWLSRYEVALLAAVVAAGLLTAILPAYRAYRYSIADGMTIRL